LSRPIFAAEHDAFREEFAGFVRREIVAHNDAWMQAGRVDRSMFAAAGAAGFLGRSLPRAYGGRDESDFRFSQIMLEEFELAGVAGAGSGLGLHNDMALPYFRRYASEGQRERWFAGLCTGARIGAIAITEPGAGSDVAGIATTATLEGDEYVLRGDKTLIGNGMNADLIIVVARDPNSDRHRGMSLFVVEGGPDGLGRTMIPKVGRKAQDTADLAFDDVRVPRANVLGDPGAGFKQLMHNLPQERLNIAAAAVAASRYAFDLTLDYARERTAFGASIGSFQHTRFVLAELGTEIEVGQAFVDDCVGRFNAGELTAERAAMAKLWCTELLARVNDRCLQVHGGFGYTEASAISWAWRDGRVTTIYGGTSEIMMEVVGRSYGL
jgi:alkylation response protein AidB-like acyl-CoA dehydrogenase